MSPNPFISAESTGRRGWWLTLALYLAMLAAVTSALLYARHQILTTLSGPEVRRQWVRESQQVAAEPGPVERQANRAPEPPSLILMRDYFGVVLTVCLLCGSLLYGFFALTIRGSLRPSKMDLSN